MLRPLRGDADRLMTALSALVAVTLILIILDLNLPASLIAFGLAGIANALFVAATLAARSGYAPRESSAQVFIWVAPSKSLQDPPVPQSLEPSPGSPSSSPSFWSLRSPR
jgi:hypothetical protein